MEENKTIEATQPKKKKFSIGKIFFLLLVCVTAYFIWQNHVEKQKEIEVNTVRYEDVMNDPYTEEDIVVWIQYNRYDPMQILWQTIQMTNCICLIRTTRLGILLTVCMVFLHMGSMACVVSI